MKTKKLSLITDSAAPKFEGFEFVTEAVDQTKPVMYTIKGIYAQAEKKNGNGRIYPYQVLKDEIDRYREQMIDTGRALGELEHPSYPEIQPAESAIRITSLVEDNKHWIGESVILASQPKFGIRGTPKGDILLSLVQYGTKMGFSTRCLGNVDENGIVNDLQLRAIDCVGEPSIQNFCESNGNRFVNGILESKQWICDIHGEILESKYDRLEKTLAKRPNTFISSVKNKHAAKAVFDFFNSLSKI